VNVLFEVRFSDLCYGFLAFRREHLDALDLSAPGFEIETELILHAIAAELRITEVPSHESPRMHGESNLRVLRDGPRVLRTLLQERFGPVRTGAAKPLEPAATRPMPLAESEAA